MKYIIDIPNDDVGRWISGTPHGLRLFVPISIEDSDEYHIKTDIPVKEYIEPDGCDCCKYTDTEEWEEPCRRCKNSYKLMRRAKE